MRVWSDKCWQCRKHGIGLPKRHGGTLRSQSGEVAGPVVRGLEAPGAHPTGSLRELRNTGAARARGGGRRLERDGPAGSLHRRAPLSADPLPGGHLDVHRRAVQSPHGPAPRHPEHARALESCAGSGGVHRRAGVDRRRRRGLHGLAGRQEGRPGAARSVAGHARQARQLRCSPLSQGRTPRGQHVGSCCLCPTSLCSGDGAAPASAKRSGLPVACVKLIAGKREHFLGLTGTDGARSGFRPCAPRPAGALTCIGKGARKSPLIRPAGFARRSVPRPAGALTCIRRGARKSPVIRPAGFARRSVPNPVGGPHLYQKGRSEVTFDPSRRICSAFRPATRQEVRLECVDVLDLINCHSFGLYPDELIN